jgi:hypothetical protein
VISYKKHHNVGPDGKAKYPLPPEGQNVNVPQLLLGNRPRDLDATSKAPEATWDEGWYVWGSKGYQAVLEHMLIQMGRDLPGLQQWEREKLKRREVWNAYQEYQARNLDAPAIDHDPRWYGLKKPPLPPPETA